LRKTDLRDLGRRVLARRLQEEGYGEPQIKSLRGAVSGARLEARRGSEIRTVAVRTSFDREVGLMRHLDGQWVTVPKVDHVVVVVPKSAKGPKSLEAEVFCFDSSVMIGAFDAALAEHQRRNPDLSSKAPIFLSLDDKVEPSGDALGGLGRKASWSEIAQIERLPEESFVDRVRREFAQLVGVDVSKVAVEFRVIG
jgi:hypothetical protein